MCVACAVLPQAEVVLICAPSDLPCVRLIHVDHGRMKIPHSIANAQSEQIKITKKMESHIAKAERILSNGEFKNRKINY